VPVSVTFRADNVTRGGGGYWTKFNTGGLLLRSNLIPFYIPFWQRRYSFYIPFIAKRYPFQRPTCNSVLWIIRWERNSYCHFNVVLNIYSDTAIRCACSEYFAIKYLEPPRIGHYKDDRKPTQHKHYWFVFLPAISRKYAPIPKQQTSIYKVYILSFTF